MIRRKRVIKASFHAKPSGQSRSQTSRFSQAESGEGLTQTKGHVYPWFYKGRQALRENLALALLIEAKELVNRQLETNHLSTTGNILELSKISTMHRA